MGFLAAFTEPQRALFESVAEVLVIPRGEFLLRRGEPGGDLFMLKSGRLEVVDARTTPEVIIAVLKEGAVVGELAFLDGSPRSVDVRTGDECAVLRWAHRDLRALLKREPVLAAAFYETVAQLAAKRMRRITDSAVAGMNAADDVSTRGASQAEAEARALAEQVKAALLRSETSLREDPTDAGAETALRDEFSNLQSRLEQLLQAWPDTAPRHALSDVLQRELHPYLVRSTLADRSIRRPQGVTATAEILTHVYVDRATGEGRVGEILDRWLLDRPTLAALRELRTAIPRAAQARLPVHRNRRVLLLNAGTGSVIAAMTELADAPTVLTVVDPSREALSFLDVDVVPVDSNVEVVAHQENLAEFTVGRLRHSYPPQDLIVLHGLLEYLPDRLAVSLLTTCAGLLNAQGAVVSAGLAESSDQHLLDRLLRWPTIRRSGEALARLHEAARFRPTTTHDTTAPAVLLTADAPVAAPRMRR